MKHLIKINGHEFECFTEVVDSYCDEDGDQYNCEDMIHHTFDGRYKFTVSEETGIPQLRVYNSRGVLEVVMRLYEGYNVTSLDVAEVFKRYYTVVTVPEEFKIYFE